MVKICVSGCCGKMGSRIVKLASADNRVNVVSCVENAHHPDVGKHAGKMFGIETLKMTVSDTPNESISAADVLIEFSTPQATLLHVTFCLENKKPIVIGTTGFDQEAVKEINSAAAEIPVLFAPNMSQGVNMLFKVCADVAKTLGDAYDVEVVEMHHRYKKDAPSGTAKKFAEELKKVKQKDIPVHALRIGEIPGDHMIVFSGNQERIELTHRAISRDVFVYGAINAAVWLADKKPGLYSMHDVIAG